jgi:hypothetical protein
MMNEVFFSGPAITEFHPETDDQDWFFSVHEAFTVRWCGITVLIPKGQETDLASIPMILQNIMPLVDNHLQIAIVHDMCYRHEVGVVKQDADMMFYDGMRTLGVGWWKAQAMYNAVRFFGDSSFKGTGSVL